MDRQDRMAITPHPDDETFTSGGLLAKLAAGGNNVQILIYTTDNAGSNDPDMTKERLAEIRGAKKRIPARSSAFPRITSPGWGTMTACWNTSIGAS